MDKKTRSTETFLAITVGVLASIFVTVILALTISLDVLSRLDDQATKLLNTMDAIYHEVGLNLNSLSQYPDTQCDKEHLVVMRRHLFQSRHLKDIGFFQNDKLVCTTGLGVLEHPVPGGNPRYRTEEGHELWINEKLVLFDLKYSAMIFRHGSHNVVVDQAELENINIAPYRWTIVYHNGDALAITPDKEMVQPAIGDSALYRNLFGTAGGIRRTLESHYLESCSINNHYCAAVEISTGALLQHYFYQFVLVALFAIISGFLSFLLVQNHLTQRHALINRVRRAFRHELFFCRYQPLVDLQHEKTPIIGCEVLSRLTDKEGDISPALFIPTLKEAGLAWPFTLRVLGCAIKELDALPNLPQGFRLSLNLFPDDLTESKVQDLLDHPVKHHPNIRLNLEILEDASLEANTARSQITRLREAGYTIAIDDFGTGYSNLNQLEKIDCHYLKIDKSFVFDIELGAIKSSLIPHIVDIGRKAKLHIVAEGIENAMQAESLKGLGVEYGQGNFFGKPLSAEQIEQLINKHRELMGEDHHGAG